MIIFQIKGMITKSTKPQKIELVKQLEKEPLPNDYNYERQLWKSKLKTAAVVDFMS